MLTTKLVGAFRYLFSTLTSFLEVISFSIASFDEEFIIFEADLATK